MCSLGHSRRAGPPTTAEASWSRLQFGHMFKETYRDPSEGLSAPVQALDVESPRRKVPAAPPWTLEALFTSPPERSLGG